MFNICLNELSRFVFLTFVFGYLWFYIGFIESEFIYCIYELANTLICEKCEYHIPSFWSIKYFPYLFQFFFRIRIPIDSQPYLKCSSVSEKMLKCFHRLIFGNLKITESTKTILATINFREGIQLKTSGLYQNIKVFLKSFRAIWKSLSLFST